MPDGTAQCERVAPDAAALGMQSFADDRALFDSLQQFRDTRINFDAAGIHQLVVRPAAGFDADRAQTGLAGGLRVVRCVAQRDAVPGFEAESFECRGEDIWMWLRAI